MVDVPRPESCVGVVGIAVGLIGILASFVLLAANVGPTWWYVFLASGTLVSASFFYCMIWEWDHFPPSGS